MTSVATSAEFAQTTLLIEGLWRDWKPTEAERELFEKKLRSLAQPRARDAIEHAYEERYTAAPSLGHIMQHYRRLLPTPPTSSTRFSREQIDDDQVSIHAALASLGVDQLVSAIDRVEATVGWPPYGSPNPQRVSDWTMGQAGIVWAAAVELEFLR